MRAIAVDLVEADEQEGFAVRAGDVLRGQDLQRAALIDARNVLGVDLDLVGERRVDRDELLGKREIVGRLAFVVGEDEGSRCPLPMPGDEPIERRRE